MLLRLVLSEDCVDLLFDSGREHVDTLFQCLVLVALVVSLRKGTPQILQRALLVFGLHEDWWDAQLPLLLLSYLVCQDQRDLFVLVDFV